MSENIYVFIDESGDFNFKENGSKYFLVSAMTITDTASLSSSLNNLKYDLLSESNNKSSDFEYFHATEDRQITRNKVFDILEKSKNIKTFYSYCKKNELPLTLKNKSTLYSALWSNIIIDILLSYKKTNLKKVIMVCDKVLTKKEIDIFFSKVKPILKNSKLDYNIYFHRTMSDMHCQAADYFSWAKFISLERSENRSLDIIKKFIVSENDINKK
jgi:hypothetical protein